MRTAGQSVSLITLYVKFYKTNLIEKTSLVRKLVEANNGNDSNILSMGQFVPGQLAVPRGILVRTPELQSRLGIGNANRKRNYILNPIDREILCKTSVTAPVRLEAEDTP